MGILEQKLINLRNARYLQANLEANNLRNVELLPLGKRLREQIEQHWQKSNITDQQIKESFFLVANEEESVLKNINSRLRFLGTKLFRHNMMLFKKTNHEILDLAVIKIKLNGGNFTQEDENSAIKLKSDNNIRSTQLITDYFFHESCGLAKLYSIQRARKIWWMRFSADPSRYYLEPFELFKPNDLSPSIMPNAQSITIKSRLPFGDLAVEHITLVPLKEADLENKSDFEIYNKRSNIKQLPAVIRSVINLDVATCALIFDGASNNKRNETLYLNRKLTPYQCQVTIESKDACSTDLKDLGKHISNVIERAGLRILKNDSNLFENATGLNAELALADRLGIPYTILLNCQSLKTGLMQLRNRDTTLKETIHISDIPRYLLNIFRAS